MNKAKRTQCRKGANGSNLAQYPECPLGQTENRGDGSQYLHSTIYP